MEQSILNGDLLRVKRLVLEDSSVLEARVGKFDGSPLHLAVVARQLEIARWLLEIGANVDSRISALGWTPLIVVAGKGYLEEARLLIDNGANIEARNWRWSVLSWACENGKAQMVRLLLECGARTDVEIRGRTPLMHACASKNLESVQLLVEKGANFMLYDDSSKMMSAFEYACQSGNPDTVRFLIECGVSVECETESVTPLMLACENHNAEVVVQLVENGANVNRQNDSGYTPLIKAVCALRPRGLGEIERLAIVRFLLKNSARINMQTWEGWSALTFACSRGDTYMARFLLESGATFELEREGAAINRAIERKLEGIRKLRGYGRSGYGRRTVYEDRCRVLEQDIGDLRGLLEEARSHE